MRYIAFVTKGLEQVAVDELHHLLDDAEIIEIGDKRVVFDSSAPWDVLTRLRTVDDLCLYASKVAPAQDLDQLRAACDRLDFDQLRAIIGQHRALNDTFSITVTMAGVRRFTASQLVAALSDTISRRASWAYTELDHSNFDVRVFVDREVAYLAIRVTAQSLMHRSYKRLSKPGSLRPTVAAAMVSLATQHRAGLSIVDNFCGSGTILCEAAASGNHVAGGDIDPESVRMTLSNISHIASRPDPQVHVLDARKTRWPAASFDCAISNLPWGKQIDLHSVAGLFDGTIKEYARIVRRGGVVCALTTRPEPLVKYARKHLPGCRSVTVPVSFTGQSPTIVVIRLAS